MCKISDSLESVAVLQFIYRSANLIFAVAQLTSGVENEIDGEALIALGHDELKEMGIASAGHRLTILKGVYDIKVKQDIPIEADDYIPPCKY